MISWDKHLLNKEVILIPKLFKLMFFLLSVIMFSFFNANAQEDASISRCDMFPPPDGKLLPLNGKIINGRYYFPKKIFSCLADDFGEGSYRAQDGSPFESCAVVGFYSSMGDFKKVELIAFPGLEKKSLDEKLLREAFNAFGIRILEKVDNAQGIEILSETMIDNMFFATISIEKMEVLKESDGSYKSSTRGYLIFQEKEKLVILTNQMVTLPGEKHEPTDHLGKIKHNILNFRRTLEFDCDP